jgi:hypothetical protein
MSGLDSLVIENKTFNLGGASYKFAPLTLLNIGRIEKHFKETAKLSYGDALGTIYSNEDIGKAVDTAIEFLYLLYLGDLSLEDFKVNLLNLKNRNEILTAINAIVSDDSPDYTFEKKSKVKGLLGWVLLILATIGMMSTLDFASRIIGEALQNFRT